MESAKIELKMFIGTRSEITNMVGEDPDARINVDFPEVSRAHKNDHVHPVGGKKCLPMEKRGADGGSVYVNYGRLKRILAGQEILTYNGRNVTNLELCQLCFPNGVPST